MTSILTYVPEIEVCEKNNHDKYDMKTVCVAFCTDWKSKGQLKIVVMYKDKGSVWKLPLFAVATMYTWGKAMLCFPTASSGSLVVFVIQFETYFTSPVFG